MKSAAEWVARLKEHGGSLRFVASGEWLMKRASEYRAQGIEDSGLIEQLVDRELQSEQDRLMAQVVKVIRSHVYSREPMVTRLLDVGVGPGELAIRLRSFDEALKYIGVDFDQEFIDETRKRLELVGGVPSNFELKRGDARQLLEVIRAASVDVAVWGKLGEHFTIQSAWMAALNSMHAVLGPDGIFLMYEPAQENNPVYQDNPSKNPGTLIRSLTEYDRALPDFERSVTVFKPFCDEVYAIALWRRSDGST